MYPGAPCPGSSQTEVAEAIISLPIPTPPIHLSAAPTHTNKGPIDDRYFGRSANSPLGYFHA